MKSFRKHIDDFFREKLGSYTETPPPDVWDALDKRLDTLVPHVKAPGTGPGGYHWLWHFAMVSTILVVGVSLTKKLRTSPAAQQAVVSEQVAAQPQQAIPVAVATAAQTPQSANNATETTNGQPENNNIKPETSGKSVAVQAGKTTMYQAKGTTQQVRPGKHQTKQVPATIGGKTAAGEYVPQAFAANSNEVVQAAQGKLDNTDEVVAKQTKKDELKPEPAKKEILPIKKPEIEEKPKSKKPSFNRFEAGVKGGYETGFTNDAASKVTLSPYVQFNITSRISLMTQPAIKYAMLRKHDVGSAQTYYQINEDGAVTTNNSTLTGTVIGITPRWVYNADYTYTQSHDSVIKSNRVGGTATVEGEIPLLLKYKVSKTVSVYGGGNLTFTKYVAITEATYSQKVVNHLSKSVSDTFYQIQAPGTPAAPDMSGSFSYSGTPLSEYKGPLQAAQQGYHLSVGFMVGFTYEYHQRWLFDALLQQSPAKTDIKNGYNINTSLSAPYLRLSVGYKLTK